MRAGRAILMMAATAASAIGCESPAERAAPPIDASEPAPGKVELVAAPPDVPDLPALIRTERARATSRGRELVVYVGATWCEPCKYFHDAAAAGRLDDVFPQVTFLELDHDRHEAGIAEAGCGSKLVPLFAVPTEAGHCSARKTEGAIKGPGAVDFITPRLRAILQ